MYAAKAPPRAALDAPRPGPPRPHQTGSPSPRSGMSSGMSSGKSPPSRTSGGAASGRARAASTSSGWRSSRRPPCAARRRRSRFQIGAMTKPSSPPLRDERRGPWTRGARHGALPTQRARRRGRAASRRPARGARGTRRTKPPPKTERAAPSRAPRRRGHGAKCGRRRRAPSWASAPHTAPRLR
jgi:hypothetical protein